MGFCLVKVNVHILQELTYFKEFTPPPRAPSPPTLSPSRTISGVVRRPLGAHMHLTKRWGRVIFIMEENEVSRTVRRAGSVDKSVFSGVRAKVLVGERSSPKEE